jgi:PKD repeat protein
VGRTAPAVRPRPTAWSFGDGSTDATGATVSHTFAVPGAYTVSATTADVFGNTITSTFPISITECESQPGVDGVTCRCTGGLASGIAACDGAAIHTSVSRKFDVACGAITAAQGATSPKKGKKSAAKAAKSFKKAAAALRGKKSKSLPAACRDALATVLGTAKDRATALKGSL